VKRALVLLAGCGTFQDPNIVVDLRVIAITASQPEQVIDVDLKNPPPATTLLAQIQPNEICALMADPFNLRRLHWQMTMCLTESDDRCDDNLQKVFGSGLIDDPDTTIPEPKICATVQPDGNLLGILLAQLKSDALQGLAGVDYMVELRVGGEGGDPNLDLYAGKLSKVSGNVPKQLTPNHNPSLDHIDAAIDGADPVPLPMGRCVDQATPLVVGPDIVTRLTPVEPPGARETYVVPTIDGSFETFTESLTYDWTASNGKISSGETGGPRDLAGNPAPLFTDFTSPSAADLMGPTDIPIWIVQRDERLGTQWYESCLRVMP
jgi:hypothetical protein